MTTTTTVDIRVRRTTIEHMALAMLTQGSVSLEGKVRYCSDGTFQEGETLQFHVRPLSMEEENGSGKGWNIRTRRGARLYVHIDNDRLIDEVTIIRK